MGYVAIALIVFINVVNIVVVLATKIYDCKQRRKKNKEFKVLANRAKSRLHSVPVLAFSRNSSTADYSHMMCTMSKPNLSRFFHPPRT